MVATDQDYSGPERRREAHLTDAQMESIADMAATKAVQKMTDNAFKAIGKSVVEKFFYAVGALTLGALFFAQTKGWINLFPTK